MVEQENKREDDNMNFKLKKSIININKYIYYSIN